MKQFFIYTESLPPGKPVTPREGYRPETDELRGASLEPLGRKHCFDTKEDIVIRYTQQNVGLHGKFCD